MTQPEIRELRPGQRLRIVSGYGMPGSLVMFDTIVELPSEYGATKTGRPPMTLARVCVSNDQRLLVQPMHLERAA